MTALHQPVKHAEAPSSRWRTVAARLITDSRPNVKVFHRFAISVPELSGKRTAVQRQGFRFTGVTGDVEDFEIGQSRFRCLSVIALITKDHHDIRASRLFA